jgi:hypothetical protein
VLLSNGVSSAVFTAPGTNDQDMQTFIFPDYSPVKRVNATVPGWNLRCLIFSERDGTQIEKVETCAGYSYGTEFVLDDGEEIIGIFGKKDSNSIDGLGFIVWKPPQI